MPKISDDIVRAVTDAAKIEDVVKDLIGNKSPDNPGGLRKTGTNYTCLCPFHEDRIDGNFIVRPSTISEKRGGNTYKCLVCNAKGGPIQFLTKVGHMTFPETIRWLGKKYSIPVDDVPVNWTPPKPKPAPPPLPVLALPKEWVKELRGEKVNDLPLVKWLRSLPWDDAQRNRIDENLWLYCVGAFKGRIVWWLIDETCIPRAAKLMDYLPNGHRDKERNPGWIYNQDGYRQQCNPDEHEIVKPLFGMHLLDKFPHATIHIVESEKTALIMATAYGNHKMSLWLACGGKENLNREKLKPLIEQGRKIVIYPDRDAIDEWRKIANDIHYERLSVNVEAVQRWWQPQDGEKADIADVVVRMLGNG